MLLKVRCESGPHRTRAAWCCIVLCCQGSASWIWVSQQLLTYLQWLNLSSPMQGAISSAAVCGEPVCCMNLQPYRVLYWRTPEPYMRIWMCMHSCRCMHGLKQAFTDSSMQGALRRRRSMWLSAPSCAGSSWQLMPCAKMLQPLCKRCSGKACASCWCQVRQWPGCHDHDPL